MTYMNKEHADFKTNFDQVNWAKVSRLYNTNLTISFMCCKTNRFRILRVSPWLLPPCKSLAGAAGATAQGPWM